jgi:GAG-pre-integrase domain/Integrase core domain
MDIYTHPSATTHITVIDSFLDEGNDLPPYDKVTLVAHAPTAKADINTWHHRLGHLNINTIKHMAKKGMVKGMEITGRNMPTSLCKPCLKGKQTHTKIQKTTEMYTDVVLGHIHSDLYGKLLMQLHQGYLYFVTWIDNKSHKVYVAGLHEKSNVLGPLKAFIIQAQVETGQHVNTLHTDGGGEYIRGAVQKYLQDNGIKHEMTMAHIPQHNGVSECMNQTLLNKVQSSGF